MKNISIEIIPRSREHFEKKIKKIKKSFTNINILNIPDLLNFDIRSWDAAIIGKKYFPVVMPHLRAIDFNLREPFELIPHFKEYDIKSVLIITGDKHQDMSKRIYRNSCLELIRIFKKEAPHIKIYAGIDQYRHSFREELDYIKEKHIAGVDGFYTQPFFDLKLLEIYLDLLKDYEIFWGISPIVNEITKNYWDSKNNVVFPTNFAPTLEWNIDFAVKAIETIKQYDTNIYFMPIRINVMKYLSKIIKNC